MSQNMQTNTNGSAQKYCFFDNASTTQCCERATELVQRFAIQDFGNPSSNHCYGQQAAQAIQEGRAFFAKTFNVEPAQVVFTGSGTEADNLAVYGVAMDALSTRIQSGKPFDPAKKPRIICSTVEHAAVKKTVQSLEALGFDPRIAPVTHDGQIDLKALEALLTPETILVSIQQVNNIVGAVLPVEDLARFCKERVPDVLFHTDSVQAFAKVETPKYPSPVDLVSISGHKVHGPKGVGALILLSPELLKKRFRPLIWGGDQEGGLRSGTQNAGLIAGFHAAAEQTLNRRAQSYENASKLRSRLRDILTQQSLLADAGSSRHASSVATGKFHWNSPTNAFPAIVNLSFPGYPAALLAKMLEERGYLVSTGSACSSHKAAPDATLCGMGYPHEICASAIRISFGSSTRLEDVEGLGAALAESANLLTTLLKS